MGNLLVHVCFGYVLFMGYLLIWLSFDRISGPVLELLISGLHENITMAPMKFSNRAGQTDSRVRNITNYIEYIIN